MEFEALRKKGNNIEVLKWTKYEELAISERLEIDRIIEESERLFHDNELLHSIKRGYEETSKNTEPKGAK
jgi:hypothetical protein